MIANIAYVLSWKSKGLSDETIKPSTTSDNSLTPRLENQNTIQRLFTKIRVKFTVKINTLKSSKHLHCL